MKRFNVKATQIDLQPLEDDTTHFSDNEQVQVKRVNFEFEQDEKLQGSYRKLTVFNNSHCYLWLRNKRKRKFKYRIDLSYLDPRPFRSKIVAWKWLVVAGLFLMLDAILIFFPWFETTVVNYHISFVAVTSIAIIFVLGFFYNSHDVVFFRSQFGRVKLIEMSNKIPNDDSFQRFLKKFIAQIKISKAAKNISLGKYLKLELKELRRLKEETVVPEVAYEKAKRLLLKNKAFTNG